MHISADGFQDSPMKSACVWCSGGGVLVDRVAQNNFVYHQRLLYVIVYCNSYFLGESNSILIVGPRGCGKSHLVQSALIKAESRSKDQALVVSPQVFR